jgi:hypothetical protein
VIVFSSSSFVLRHWGLNSGPIPFVILPTLFSEKFFQNRVSLTICLGWLQTVILLISAFWVTRITGVSHWHPAGVDFITIFLYTYIIWFGHSCPMTLSSPHFPPSPSSFQIVPLLLSYLFKLFNLGYTSEKNTQYLPFWVCLISLNMILLLYIHFVASNMISWMLFTHKKILCIYYIFFFFFWGDSHLNSELCTYKVGTLLREPHLHSILLWLLWW